MNVQSICETISASKLSNSLGKIKKVMGLTIEAAGCQTRIGDLNIIEDPQHSQHILAEAVGVNEDRTILMPYDDISGIALGHYVQATGSKLKIPVGDFLTGRIIDATGSPIDGLGEFTANQYYQVEHKSINPFERERIDTRLEFGIKAIDGLLTVGKGQRMGIFAGSGVGKSTLLGMIAKNVKADINVIALVGERGREVREFIERDLGEEGLKRSVVVVATSDQPAMLRKKCALAAVTVAEYFRDQGKDVLLMMDSLTRFAMAQREIGLATHEPPVARGYTPSIFAELPKLLERSGNFKVGSITAIYTVLVEGDDTNEPISDTVRGIVDGHIVLSRSLAERNHFPAIDICQSISRLMNEIVDLPHKELASSFRNLLSVYNENYDLISIGAYKSGGNKRLDTAVAKIDEMNTLLCQGTQEVFTGEQTVQALAKLLA